MQRKVALSVIVFVFTLVVGTGVALAAESDQKDLADFYAKVLDEKINQCLSKSSLKNSKSEILRDCAFLESEKAIFLKENKDHLIKGMLEQNIGKKMYKIDFYLNKEFFDNKRKIARTESAG